MIFDHISNLSTYNGTGRNISKFTSYVKENDITALEAGRYVIDDDVFFDVKTYAPRTAEVAGWETHEKYIDIQYLLEGRELMGIMPANELTVKNAYDEALDKTSYEPSEYETTLKLRPGMFALLLPQDAHHPSIIDGEMTSNKKVVVKIRI